MRAGTLLRLRRSDAGVEAEASMPTAASLAMIAWSRTAADSACASRSATGGLI